MREKEKHVRQMGRHNCSYQVMSCVFFFYHCLQWLYKLYRFNKIVIQNSWPSQPKFVEYLVKSCGPSWAAGKATAIDGEAGAFTAQLAASRRRHVAGGQWFETFGRKNRWCFCIIPIQWAWIRGCMDVR